MFWRHNLTNNLGVYLAASVNLGSMKSLRPNIRNCVLLSALLLTACATAGAEPERYAGMDCQQLSDLQKSYNQSLAQFDPFIDADINERARGGKSSRNDSLFVGQSRSDLTPGQIDFEKDLNSIRAASRLKGC
jgi:hypothetical protein